MAQHLPHVQRLVQWVAILSDGEADACIRDYRAGLPFSGEAVNHFGGTHAVIERAVAMRCVLRDMWEHERRVREGETMQTRFNPDIDRSSWGSGPWDGEPDEATWTDDATGLPCRARRHPSMGHWCGYVGILSTHPDYGLSYDDVDVDVHGGLTYSADTLLDSVPIPASLEDRYWFGFDCAHGFDKVPGFSYLRDQGEYRTLDYVREQCRSLAKQLAARQEILAETMWDRSMAEHEAEYNALQDTGAD